MASEWAQLPNRIKEVLLTFKKGYEILNTHHDMLTLAEHTHVDNAPTVRFEHTIPLAWSWVGSARYYSGLQPLIVLYFHTAQTTQVFLEPESSEMGWLLIAQCWDQPINDKTLSPVLKTVSHLVQSHLSLTSIHVSLNSFYTCSYLKGPILWKKSIFTCFLAIICISSLRASSMYKQTKRLLRVLRPLGSPLIANLWSEFDIANK